MGEEERLHVWNFDPLTKDEFTDFMIETAKDLELYQKSVYGSRDLTKVNKLREIVRKVHYTGEAYRADPKEFYSEHSKPLELAKNSSLPKVEIAIVEKCLYALSELITPTIDELNGLLISKRWHYIPSNDICLNLLVERRDSYLFVIELVLELFNALEDIEINKEEIKEK